MPAALSCNSELVWGVFVVFGSFGMLVRCSRMFQDAPGCSRMLQDAPGCFKMVSKGFGNDAGKL